MTKQNVALVVGSTGIVGEALVELLSKPDAQGGPWKVIGLARRPRPDWLTSEIYVQCDLTNREDTLTKVSRLTDVTHLFWVAWIRRPTEAENIAANGAMFRNVLNALGSKNLEHIALQTGGKQYVGSFEAQASGGVVHYDIPFSEDLPRQNCLNFYYALEDIMLETVEKSQGKITWTVHRPALIFGLAAGNYMNFLGSIGVYAAICKKEGIPFVFPGTQFCWECVQEASSADLIAEQEIWAATDPRGKNQAFNSMNGDFFVWTKLWKSVAEKLGLEYVPYSGQPRPLSESMKGKEAVWDEIVKEHGLVPTKLEQVGHWGFMDWYFSIPKLIILSMNKSKEHGFFGFRNTEKTFLTYFDKMRERKLIP